MKFKTNFCERIYNLNPTICFYDKDNVLVDSSHRARLDEHGDFDLDYWRENKTKDKIFSDILLPDFARLQEDYRNGNIVVIITADELNKYDMEFIHSHNIYYDYIYSRPKNCTLDDWQYKLTKIRHFWCFKQFYDLPKRFYDDKLENLKAVKQLGNVDCYHVPSMQLVKV